MRKVGSTGYAVLGASLVAIAVRAIVVAAFSYLFPRTLTDAAAEAAAVEPRNPAAPEAEERRPES